MPPGNVFLYAQETVLSPSGKYFCTHNKIFCAAQQSVFVRTGNCSASVGKLFLDCGEVRLCAGVCLFEYIDNSLMAY